MYTQVKKELKMDGDRKDFLVFYVHDGMPLADYIKEKFTDTKFACTVEILDITDTCKNLKNNSDFSFLQNATVNILIVSPAFLNYAQSSGNVPYDVIFPVPEKTVALFFYVDVEEAERFVKGCCDGSAKWTRKDTGNNKESLRECLVTLITLLEEDNVVCLPILKKFSLMPSTVTSNVDKIYVMFTQEMQGKVEVLQDTEKLEAVFYNPYTYVFKPLGHFCGMSEIQVFVDGSAAGKESLFYLSCTEELERLLSKATNPLDLIFTAVTGEKACHVAILDQTLDHMFCSSSCVISSNLDGVILSSDEAREQEYPTLMHLAARYGLKNLCASILDTPGGKLARDIKNIDGLKPSDIAVKYGHATLSKSLRTSFTPKMALPPPPIDEQDYQQEKLEAYCDMAIGEDKKLKEMTSRRAAHYDFIDDQHVPDVQRSVSSPATMEPSFDTYMDMEGLKDTKKFRSRIGPKDTKPPLPDVTRRQRSKTVDSEGSRDSARISLIKEEDLLLLPRPKRDERIYTTIRDIPGTKKKSTRADVTNFRKS